MSFIIGLARSHKAICSWTNDFDPCRITFTEWAVVLLSIVRSCPGQYLLEAFLGCCLGCPPHLITMGLPDEKLGEDSSWTLDSMAFAAGKAVHLLEELDCFLFLSTFYWLCYYICPNFFSPFSPSFLHGPPPAFPPLFSSCPWVIHISSLAFSFPILFLTSPCLFCTYHLCFLFLIFFPPFSPFPSHW